MWPCWLLLTAAPRRVWAPGTRAPERWQGGLFLGAPSLQKREHWALLLPCSPPFPASRWPWFTSQGSCAPVFLGCCSSHGAASSQSDGGGQPGCVTPSEREKEEAAGEPEKVPALLPFRQGAGLRDYDRRSGRRGWTPIGMKEAGCGERFTRPSFMRVDKSNPSLSSSYNTAVCSKSFDG